MSSFLFNFYSLTCVKGISVKSKSVKKEKIGISLFTIINEHLTHSDDKDKEK